MQSKLHSITYREYAKTELLTKAYENSSDPIERMKYLCAYFISGLYKSPDFCRSKAPFNPILGETYQAVQPDGSEIYLEQTLHYPPTFNYLLYGPSKHYQMMGYGTINAHMDGLNTIRGWRDGKNIIKFEDGSIITFTNFLTRINGIMMGDRIYNYYGTQTIKDFKNKIECTIVLEDQEKEGVISKILFKKKIVQYDEFKIEIKQLNPETNIKELKATGYGSWLGQLYFGDKCYWSYFDSSPEWVQDNLWLLPSDSTKREDLICVIKGDIENAQIHKDRLEEVQRQDQKKRDEYKKTISK